MANCSVVIIAHNMQHAIANCITSAFKITDDVVLVDSGSNDNTVNIAKALGANVVYKTWVGYSANKNYGNIVAKNNLVCWLDADEEISDALALEIKEMLSNYTENTCYSINRLNFFNNKPILYGAWNPDWQVRLFNKNFIKWDEHKLVHETLIIDSQTKIIKLKNRLHHFTTNNFNNYLLKMKKYANQYQLNNHKNIFKMLLSPPARFIKEYILRLGFLDGANGFKIALAHAVYVFLKYKP